MENFLIFLVTGIIVLGVFGAILHCLKAIFKYYKELIFFIIVACTIGYATLYMINTPYFMNYFN